MLNRLDDILFYNFNLSGTVKKMPFPPPPPPPGPPPPPAFTPAPAAAASAEGRGLLLQSIRQGTNLRKTVTNDKSAPLVSGVLRQYFRAFKWSILIKRQILLT